MRIRRKLNQFAVYWPRAKVEDNGKQSFAAPVEIKCRWEDSQVEVKDMTRTATNGLWSSKSVIDTEYPVEKGGYLWFGRLSALQTPDDPRKVGDAGRIEYRDKIPSVRATQTLYTAYL
jgi:hypothetical protein